MQYFHYTPISDSSVVIFYEYLANLDMSKLQNVEFVYEQQHQDFIMNFIYLKHCCKKYPISQREQWLIVVNSFIESNAFLLEYMKVFLIDLWFV